MRRRSTPSSRAGRGRLAVFSTLPLLLLHVLQLCCPMGVSAATNDTSPAAAASPQCASAGQLAAGSASCSPACSAENTAACLTLSNANRSVCDPGNFTAGCPLIESGNCLVKCLPWVETTQNDTFIFYVTPPSIASANASDWGRTVLWQNQQFLTSIGAIAVPDRIQYVYAQDNELFHDRVMIRTDRLSYLIGPLLVAPLRVLWPKARPLTSKSRSRSRVRT
jgi:hypothetical protein